MAKQAQECETIAGFQIVELSDLTDYLESKISTKTEKIESVFLREIVDALEAGELDTEGYLTIENEGDTDYVLFLSDEAEAQFEEDHADELEDEDDED